MKCHKPTLKHNKNFFSHLKTKFSHGIVLWVSSRHHLETTASVSPDYHLIFSSAKHFRHQQPLHEGGGQVDMSSKRLCEGNFIAATRDPWLQHMLV